MEPSQRIVTRMPLMELWNERGSVEAERGPQIGGARIEEILQAGGSFIVADAGQPLQWIPANEGFQFWKSEVKSRLIPVEASSWFLEDFPGQYCFLATEWRLRSGGSLVVLEKHH